MPKLNWYKVDAFSYTKPVQRWGHSSAVLGNQLIIFGGYADSNYMNDLWIFNSVTLQWRLQETFGDIPEARSNATLSFDKQQNCLILFGGGGQGKKRFNSLYSLDWTTKKWREILTNHSESSPWERTYHISQIIGNYLVIFGGQNFTDLNDLWLFDLKQEIWKQVLTSAQETKPCPRRFHTSVVRKNQLIIIGGCHNKYRSLNCVFRMDFNQFLKTKDLKSLSWKETKVQSSDFIPRWGHSSTYNPIDDQIYIFGGRFSSDLQDIISLDITKATSKKIYVVNQPSPRRRHSANFIGTSLLVFGGFNGSYFNDLYTISIPSEKPTPKFLKDSVISFSEMLKQNWKFTVSFLKNYIKDFENWFIQIQSKYSNQEVDEIITSVVYNHQISPKIYSDQIEKLKKRQRLSIFKSKQEQIQSIKKEWIDYSVFQEQWDQFPVLKQSSKNLAEKKNKKLNLGNSSNGVKENIFQNQKKIDIQKQLPEIIFLNQIEFMGYLNKQGKKVKTVKRINGWKQKTEENNLQNQMPKIKIGNCGQITLNMIAVFSNIFLWNCFKESKQIFFENMNQKYLRIFQVGLMFIETSILVVPQNFSLEQWKYLSQFSNYFCVENLNQIIEKYLVSKIQISNLSELSQVASSMRMNKLMSCCASLIIQREEQTFFQSPNSQKETKGSNKKINPQHFLRFQKQFFSTCTNFIYPQQFQKHLTTEFQQSKLNILLRNIHKTKSANGKNKQNEQMNEQKQNEQNMVHAMY